MQRNSMTALAFSAAVFATICAVAAPARRNAQQKDDSNNEPKSNLSPDKRGAKAGKTTAATFGPERTKSVQSGEFQVDLVVIAFPDCQMPESVDAVKEELSKVEGGTITDYYKDYSQGITWPVLAAYQTVYMAPQPLGYYCRWDYFANPLGYKNDGHTRAAKLRADALKFAQSNGRLQKKGAYTCYVYCKSLNKEESVLEKYIRPFYKKPTPEDTANGVTDNIEKYNPAIQWADPLWPNSIPQVHYPGNGRTLVHEIGHCLGSPDFYHATEEHDGLEGAPSLPWSYGPTGPAYCRYIYHAFVPEAAYPKITKSGDVTLSPRSARFPMTDNKEIHPLGIMVPTQHPNYMLLVEYCHREKRPVGDPGAEGLLVHAINVTMTSPMLGPPDMCYTYRSDDADFKATGEDGKYFRSGDSFTATTNPSSLLPNLIPSGISITDIKENSDGTCSFHLDVSEEKPQAAQLQYSLLPQTEIVSIDGMMPTSFHAVMNVKYRGEPLLTEYGFCYGTTKDPTEKTGKLFALHHRDRYDARIIDLKPDVMYYVRAYARNANGIRYSKNQKGVKLPDPKLAKTRATLFSPSDNLLSNWYYQKWYFGESGGVFNSANPIFAFMALANYYREMPGASGGKSGTGVNLEQVHCNPSDTRPKFRLAETEKLKTALEKLLSDAGFLQPDFKPKQDVAKAKSTARQTGSRGGKASYGNNAQWVSKCATALKIKSPEKVFFSCATEDEMKALAPAVRTSILKSQPVLVVRQNKPMSDELSVRWPLHIAIIDGLGPDEETFHVVFPGGADRGRKGLDDTVKLTDLLERTTDAMMMFYRPGQSR